MSKEKSHGVWKGVQDKGMVPQHADFMLFTIHKSKALQLVAGLVSQISKNKMEGGRIGAACLLGE